MGGGGGEWGVLLESKHTQLKRTPLGWGVGGDCWDQNTLKVLKKRTPLGGGGGEGGVIGIKTHSVKTDAPGGWGGFFACVLFFKQQLDSEISDF